MTTHLAIVVYRSLINGIASGALDFQVRWFPNSEPEQIRRTLRSEPFTSYQNDAGETVTWEFVEIMAIDEFSPGAAGDEVTGFIARVGELTDLV